MSRDRLSRNVRGLRFWITCKIKIEVAHIKGCLFLPPTEVATLWTFCAGSPALSPTEQHEEDQMEPVLTGGHILGEDLSSGNLNFSNVDEAHPPFAAQGDTVSLFSSCSLYKHPWKDSLEQKDSQCLTWKMSKNVRDKSSPNGIYLNKLKIFTSSKSGTRLEEMSVSGTVLIWLTAQTELV